MQEVTKKIKWVNIFICFVLVISCTHSINNPLQRGLVFKMPDKSFDIYSLESSYIKAIENCKINKIKLVDSLYVIIAVGNHKVYYSNIFEPIVKEDQAIKKGTIIGRIDSIKNKFSNHLILSIQDKKGNFIDDVNFKDE